MKKILTLTFNPALDKSVNVPELVPEKKLKASGAKTEPGGGGINVSRALLKLGFESKAVYLSGGYTGKQFDTLLAAEGVAAFPISIKNDTRENFVVLDESSGKQYRFGLQGPEVISDEWLAMLQYVSEQDDIAYIVTSGSLPPGVPSEALGQLAVIAKQKKAKLVVDTSGDALKYAVQEGVYLIKPNLAELAALYGKEKLGDDEIITAAGNIIAKGGCEMMAVSMGADGALLVTANEHWQIRPPHVEIHSTVGAGDSMVAGMAAALSQDWPLPDVLRYGVAAGTAATLNAGTELCKKEDTERLFAQMKEK